MRIIKYYYKAIGWTDQNKLEIEIQKIPITKFDVKSNKASQQAGVVYDIFRKKDGVKVTSITSKAKGIVKTRLGPGEYYVVERML